MQFKYLCPFIQVTLKYTDKIFLEKKFFLLTDPTLIGMGYWRGNEQILITAL